MEFGFYIIEELHKNRISVVLTGSGLSIGSASAVPDSTATKGLY
jgi:hypothetical protein